MKGKKLAESKRKEKNIIGKKNQHMTQKYGWLMQMHVDFFSGFTVLPLILAELSRATGKLVGLSLDCEFGILKP